MEGQPVEISVKGVVNAFPTLDPGESPFLIINLDHMIQYLLSVSASRLGEVNELWLSLDVEADRAVTLAKLQSLSPLGEAIRDREGQAEIAASNPLLGGAWESIALQGAIALGCASLLGFGLYAGITVRRSRLELGVLQALGFSRRHVALLLAAEGAMVGIIGIGVGTAVGAWLSRWTLGFMSVTAGGRPLAPPLLLTADVWLLALALAEAALAVAGSVVLAMVLANKLRLHEVLRMEE
jgi:cell division protein FtsX